MIVRFKLPRYVDASHFDELYKTILAVRKHNGVENAPAVITIRCLSIPQPAVEVEIDDNASDEVINTILTKIKTLIGKLKD